MNENQIDQALTNSNSLIGINVDTHSMQDILSEISVQLETCQKEIIQINNSKDKKIIENKLDKIEERISKLENQADLSRPQSASNIPEKFEEEISKITVRLTQLIEDTKNEIKKQTDSDLADATNQITQEFQKDLLRFSTIEQLDELSDKIKTLNKRPTQTSISPDIIQSMDEMKNDIQYIKTNLTPQEDKIRNLQITSEEHTKTLTQLESNQIDLKSTCESIQKRLLDSLSTYNERISQLEQSTEQILSRISKIDKPPSEKSINSVQLVSAIPIEEKNEKNQLQQSNEIYIENPASDLDILVKASVEAVSSQMNPKIESLQLANDALMKLVNDQSIKIFELEEKLNIFHQPLNKNIKETADSFPPSKAPDLFQIDSKIPEIIHSLDKRVNALEDKVLPSKPKSNPSSQSPIQLISKVDRGSDDNDNQLLIRTLPKFSDLSVETVEAQVQTDSFEPDQNCNKETGIDNINDNIIIKDKDTNVNDSDHSNENISKDKISENNNDTNDNKIHYSENDAMIQTDPINEKQIQSSTGNFKEYHNEFSEPNEKKEKKVLSESIPLTISITTIEQFEMESLKIQIEEIRKILDRTEKGEKEITYIENNTSRSDSRIGEMQLDLLEKEERLKTLEIEKDDYAHLPMVKNISINFQRSLDDFEKQIKGIQAFLSQTVMKKDLNELVAQLQAAQSRNDDGMSAAARMNMRCLLCGHPITAVQGTITESEAAKLLGTPVQSGMVRGGKGEGKYVLVYGKDSIPHNNDKNHRKTSLPPIGSPQKK